MSPGRGRSSVLPACFMLPLGDGIRAIEQSLVSYLASLEEHCLLSPVTRTLYQHLEALLDCVAQFCVAYLRQRPTNRDGEGFQQMANLYTRFLQRLALANVVMDQLVNSRLAPYVEALRVRLDFNGFFFLWRINSRHGPGG